ncbi:MAG: hypothetical protein P8100_11225 [bacterium]|jgi:hypothetical protein
MKPHNYIITALIILSLAISSGLSAHPFNNSDEKYIDDIPFDTEEISEQVFITNTALSIQFEEESYIEDIPFDTQLITERAEDSIFLASAVDFEEEPYIDDIPFDTFRVAEKVWISETFVQDIEMEEEPYIDDIPFDTRKVISRYLSQRITGQFRVAGLVSVIF